MAARMASRARMRPPDSDATAISRARSTSASAIPRKARREAAEASALVRVGLGGYGTVAAEYREAPDDDRFDDRPADEGHDCGEVEHGTTGR